MDRKKDIGHIFKERLGDLKDSPRENLWNAIASEIDENARKRIAPLWYYTSGALLVITAIALLTFQPWVSKKDTQETLTPSTPHITKGTQNKATSSPVIIASENETNSKTEINSSTHPKDPTQNVKEAISRGDKNPRNSSNLSSHTTSTNNTNTINYSNNALGVVSHSSNSTNNRSTQIPVVSSRTSLVTTNKKEKGGTPLTKEDTAREIKARAQYEAKIAKELRDAINAQLAENEKNYQEQLKLEAIAAAQREKILNQEKEKMAAAKTKAKESAKTDEERAFDRKAATEYKIAISPYTSLINYGSLAKGSSIDDRLEDNPRESISTVGYGVRMDYPISEKASIRVGLGVAPLRYRTDNFQVSSINGNINIFQLSAISGQGINQPGIETSIEAQNFFQENTVVSIEQDISYLEIPVDYQYRLLNKRIGLSLNSGLSLFVLTENSVFATADNGSSILIGRETDLKDLSIAFNLGLGAYYNISKNWRFDAEPAFKYQINPYIDGNTNFRPYYFGVQFGISHKF